MMSYRYSFYFAIIYSFLHQIDVVPMQWLSPLLRFFYAAFHDLLPLNEIFPLSQSNQNVYV